jgi:outer membrane protein OmpA-like peptidoglycan-associated protein
MKLTLATLIFLIFFISNDLYAQNLVVNPGFESLNSRTRGLTYCHYTGSPGHFNFNLLGWNTFRGITPDLIVNPDTLTGCYYPKPRTGNNMLGLILYHPKEDTDYESDYHEIVQGKLKKPLKKGETYEVSLWFTQDDELGKQHLREVYYKNTPVFSVASNNLGILFTDIAGSESENIQESIKTFGMKPQLVFEEILISGKGEWVQLKATFVARAAYKYFMIGNFSTDFRTSVQPDNFEEIYPAQPGEKDFFQKPKRIAYYCIDDISVAVAGSIPNIEEALEKAKVYTFKNVNFENGKSVLLPAAKEELEQLALWLNKYPEKRIEISGHTDNVGSPEANQVLSEKRAQAVFDYLINKGNQETQLQFKGYGENKPKTTNETVKGRQINRRVECEILN